MTVPPHAGGAPVLLLEMLNDPHPPDAVAVDNQLAYALFTAACVWQEAVFPGAGQFIISAGGLATVNIALHVCVWEQASVAVKVTVTLPPHASGAPVLLLE